MEADAQEVVQAYLEHEALCIQYSALLMVSNDRPMTIAATWIVSAQGSPYKAGSICDAPAWEYMKGGKGR